MMECLQEKKILEQLDDLLKKKDTIDLITPIINEVKKELEQKKIVSVTKNIPVESFSSELPTSINLCRLFILKANTKSKIERHTNSHQRTYTLYGKGDTKIFENNVWKSNVRKSSGNSIEDKWLSVPENTWHQPIALLDDWITITFHTASESEIVDEYKE